MHCGVSARSLELQMLRGFMDWTGGDHPWVLPRGGDFTAVSPPEGLSVCVKPWIWDIFRNTRKGNAASSQHVHEVIT